MASINVNGIDYTFPGVWYVNAETGSDITGDGTESNPFQSVGAAHTAMASGDAIKLMPVSDIEKYSYYLGASLDGNGNAHWLQKEVHVFGSMGQALIGSLEEMYLGKYTYGSSESIYLYQCLVAVNDIMRNAPTGKKLKMYNCAYTSVAGTAHYPNGTHADTNYHRCLIISPQQFISDTYWTGGMLRNACTVYDSIISGFAHGTPYGGVYAYNVWQDGTYYETKTPGGNFPINPPGESYVYAGDFYPGVGHTAIAESVGLYSGPYAWKRTKILFEKSGTYYSYDSTNGFQSVSIGGATPTSAEIETLGSAGLKSIPRTEFETMLTAGQINFVAHNPTWNAVDSLNGAGTYRNNPSIIVQTTPTDMSSYDGLVSVSFTGTGKIAVSPDGVNFYVFDSGTGTWSNLGNLVVDDASASTLLGSGMDSATINAITKDQWALLDITSLAFAYGLGADDTLEDIYITTRAFGNWQIDYSSTIKLDGSGFDFIPASNGTYKVNYQDE